jgi:hypothetical protein
MITLARKKGWMQVLAVLVICSFSTWAIASGLNGARIMPSSKVAIYDGAKRIGEISNEAPLPEGKILSSDKPFGLKLHGIYLLATEKTKLAVTPLGGGQDVFVQEGRVYFAIRAIENTLTFSTPQDSVTVENVIIQASTGRPLIKGYLAFENKQMELAVTEGGQLRVVSAHGQQIIEPGNKLMVQKAQANLGGGGAGAGGFGWQGWTLIGFTGAGIIAGPIIYNGWWDNGDEVPTSPFKP